MLDNITRHAPVQEIAVHISKDMMPPWKTHMHSNIVGCWSTEVAVVVSRELQCFHAQL